MQPEMQAMQPAELDPITAAQLYLAHEGYKVVDTNLLITHPSIMIEADPRLAQMVAEQSASYYVTSATKRVGQFRVNGVRIIWVEEVQR